MTNEAASHLGLLIVDVQDCFLKQIDASEGTVQRIAFAAEAAQILGCQTAVTEQLPAKLGHTTEPLTSKLAPNTPIFEKTTFSAVGAKGIHRWLESNQLDHVLLCGFETPICIYQTALELTNQDIGVTVLSDCIGERRPQDRSSVLTQLLSMDVHILPSETIFYSLMGDAANPSFRNFTELVKRYSV